jgi:multicomponent Na+:H+ antiporter subunit E
MSGIQKPLTLGLGAASSLFAVWVVRRMDNAADAGRLQVNLRPIEFIKYLFWLLVEIAKANWAVTKIILSPEMKIKQHVFDVPFTQKSDLGQAIFANSITLTPGTISVEVEPDHFLVHALSYSSDDPAAIADMDARVTKIEGRVS